MSLRTHLSGKQGHSPVTTRRKKIGVRTVESLPHSIQERNKSIEQRRQENLGGRRPHDRAETINKTNWAQHLWSVYQ